MNVIIEGNRDWDFVKEGPKVLYLLKEKVKSRSFYMKGTEPPAEFYPETFTDKGVEFICPPDVEKPEQITLYTTLNRHLEVDLKFAKEVEPGRLLLEPVEARISKVQRQSKRFSNMNHYVVANNFMVSKDTITVNMAVPQVANKVIYGEFERNLGKIYPGIKIFDYADKSRPELTRLLNRQTESILIEEVGNIASYGDIGPEFLDVADELDDDASVQKLMRRLQEDHVVSVLCVPLLYELPNHKMAPLGFMYGESRTERYDRTTHEKWKENATEIITRITDANTVQVKTKQNVVNFSEGGVALEITDPELVKYVPNRAHLTFDLIFKMQAPIRFHGRLAHLVDYGGRIVAGVNLEGSGHSETRQSSLDRYRSLVRMGAAEAS